MAVQSPSTLIEGFMEALAPLGFSCQVRHESQPAPHKGKPLPRGECAVYVFTLTKSFGEQTTAGAHRALKVGKAGLRCSARFQSQHYSPNAAPSTLAATLLKTNVLWPFIGIAALDANSVRHWIEANTDPDNFFLTDVDAHLLGKLETFLKGYLGPVFEGGTE